MKKLLAILLTLMFVLSLSACGEKDTSDSGSTTDSQQSQTESTETDISSEQSSNTSSEADTPSKPESKPSNTSSDSKNNSSVVSNQTTSSQPKPTAPTKLNPKTSFKYGKYATEFFGEGKKSYTKCSLNFAEDYDGHEYQRITYYTKEECERLYGDWGFDANDPATYERDITIDNVKYYNMTGFDTIAEAYEMTDTVIKVTSDFEKFAHLSLNADGTLVVDVAAGDRYGAVGTIYKYVEQ